MSHLGHQRKAEKTDAWRESKLETSGLDSCPQKSQHSKLGVVLSTAEQGDGHVAYRWTRRRDNYLQINMKAECMASRPRWQVSWVSTGAVSAGEQSLAGNMRERRWIFFENAANARTWSPRKASPFLWALLRGVDKRGAIPSWVWGSGVPKMSVPMSTAHIHSGLHPLRASSTPYSHKVTSVPQEQSWTILSSLWDPRPCPAQQRKMEDWLMEGHLAISRTSSKNDHQQLYSFPSSLPTHLPSKNSVSQAMQRNSLWLFL